MIARDWQTMPENGGSISKPTSARWDGGSRRRGPTSSSRSRPTTGPISSSIICQIWVIGVGETHEGPPEPFLKDFAWKQIPGHPRFAMHLLETALKQDFEPSLSHHLMLDHGFCIPLLRMELARMPAIVPITVNCIEPPMMSIRRCLAWGRLLRQAIETYPSRCASPFSRPAA